MDDDTETDQLEDATPPTQTRKSPRKRPTPRETGALREKAAPSKEPKYTDVTCQKLLNHAQGGGHCGKPLDPKTEIGHYRRCKEHRDLEAGKQRETRERNKIRGQTKDEETDAAAAGTDVAEPEGGTKRKRKQDSKLAPRVSTVWSMRISCINWLVRSDQRCRRALTATQARARKKRRTAMTM